jgi:hypothetical protein
MSDNRVVNAEEQEEVLHEGVLESPQVRNKTFSDKKALVEWLSWTTAVELAVEPLRGLDGKIPYLVKYKEVY